MFRHLFLLILTIILTIVYVVTLDYGNFSFIDVIILFMLLFSMVFNGFVVYTKHKVDAESK